jgi:hypothetical protein
MRLNAASWRLRSGLVGAGFGVCSDSGASGTGGAAVMAAGTRSRLGGSARMIGGLLARMNVDCWAG